MSRVTKLTISAITVIGIICVLIIVYNVLDAKFKPIIPNVEFAFISTPQNGQKGGIEGIYYYEYSRQCHPQAGCKMSYLLLRFYEDGDVIAEIVGRPKLRSEELSEVESWLRRGNEDLVQGQYFVSEKKIWFSIGHSDSVYASDYYGIILDNRIVFDCHNSENVFDHDLDNAVYSKLGDETEK